MIQDIINLTWRCIKYFPITHTDEDKALIDQLMIVTTNKNVAELHRIINQLNYQGVGIDQVVPWLNGSMTALANAISCKEWESALILLDAGANTDPNINMLVCMRHNDWVRTTSIIDVASIKSGISSEQISLRKIIELKILDQKHPDKFWEDALSKVIHAKLPINNLPRIVKELEKRKIANEELSQPINYVIKDAEGNEIIQQSIIRDFILPTFSSEDNLVGEGNSPDWWFFTFY